MLCPWCPMIVSRSPAEPKTARPSGEKPGMDRDPATRSTSAVDRASASARPASSRNASRDRRQSPVIGVWAASVAPGCGSATSWSVP
ncbi:hypothetical protein GA0115253_1070218 [Streptomyces sp. Termitarium-T10T-6]|nr:hypothetical protein GA0115253_1070218 [Streptomyces sp. Termitarium-T10T-6]